MEMPEQEWSQVGRVEFHLNGGITRVCVWAGGPLYINIETEGIPRELREIGTWLDMKLNSRTGWSVNGRGAPDPFIERWLAGEDPRTSA